MQEITGIISLGCHQNHAIDALLKFSTTDDCRVMPAGELTWCSMLRMFCSRSAATTFSASLMESMSNHNSKLQNK